MGVGRSDGSVKGYSSGLQYTQASGSDHVHVLVSKLEAADSRFPPADFCMCAFRLFQEPFRPALFPPFAFPKLGKRTRLVHLCILAELCALDQLKDDGVLEALQDGADVFEREQSACA